MLGENGSHSSERRGEGASRVEYEVGVSSLCSIQVFDRLEGTPVSEGELNLLTSHPDTLMDAPREFYQLFEHSLA